MTPLCDSTQLAEVLGTTGSGNPALKTRLLDVCSEHVMNYCRRRFLPAGVDTKTVRVKPSRSVISLVPWDFQADQTVTVVVDPLGSNNTLVLEDDFYIAPEASVWGIADRVMLHIPLRAFRATRVDITATYGWADIPSPVSEAVAIWVRDVLHQISAYPQGQQMEEAEALLADGRVPDWARMMLTPFRHMVVV